MRTTFLLSGLCTILLWHTAAYANDSARVQLQTAAIGPEFTIARTAFRLVPAAAVNKLDEPDAPAVRGELARIGAYSIGLGGASGGAGRALSDAVGSNVNNYGVAMDQRSGMPVLVAPRLKVYCKDAAQAKALAQAGGGKLLMASAPAQLVILGYPTPAAALAAIPLFKGQPCVRAVEPEIVRSFAVPQ